VTIRPASRDDFPRMLAIFRKVLESGEADVLEADAPILEVRDYWFGKGIDAFVAEKDGRIVGMSRRSGEKGRSRHVANVSVVVDPSERREGVGLALGQDLVEEARDAGFRALQANMVVRSDRAALALARRLGFTIVGTLPRAFRHKRLGFVDAHVMHRFL
jgi:L-amino acid N-acyltransferase YncA